MRETSEARLWREREAVGSLLLHPFPVPHSPSFAYEFCSFLRDLEIKASKQARRGAIYRRNKEKGQSGGRRLKEGARGAGSEKRVGEKYL